jgi:hypothetical protein
MYGFLGDGERDQPALCAFDLPTFSLSNVYKDTPLEDSAFYGAGIIFYIYIYLFISFQNACMQQPPFRILF